MKDDAKSHAVWALKKERRYHRVMIVGITGTIASGKDTVAEYLRRTGFRVSSISEAIRLELKQQNLPATRENLKFMGDRMRTKHGSEFLAKQALRAVEGSENAAVIPLFNIAEAQFLRKKGAILIGVDAPIELRWQRAKSRGRITDDVTLEQFKRDEAVRTTSEKAGHQLEKVMAMADVIIQNDGTVEELRLKVDEILKRFDKRRSHS